MRHVFEDLVNDLRYAKGDLDVQHDPKTGKIKAARSYRCPLDFYERRGIITPEQHDAGLRLANLWHYGVWKANFSQWRYEPSVGAGMRKPQHLNDAGWSFLKALKAVENRAERRVMIRVCCHDLPAGEGKPIQLLRGALDDLERHFRR